MVPVLLTGCLLYDDRCGDESRDITATTRFAETGGDPEVGYTQVTLVEHRTQEPLESMWWVLLSDSLKGRIQTARLMDTGNDFAVLLELPVETGVDDQALTGALRPYAGPTPFVELFDFVREGRVALELTTNISGREFLRRTLIPDEYEGWSRPHCS
jgi:hypothetical protein